MVGICEVGTTPGRPTAPSSAAAAPTVPFERPWALLLARGVNLACGLRDGGLSPSCTAQLVFVSVMAGISEAVAAPDVHHRQIGSVILTIRNNWSRHALQVSPLMN